MRMQKAWASVEMPGRSKSGALQAPCDEAVLIHLGAGCCAHAVGSGAVGGGEPLVDDSLIDGECEHLRQVGFDEGVGAIDDVVEEAVWTLMREAAVDHIAGKCNQMVAIVLSVQQAGCG